MPTTEGTAAMRAARLHAPRDVRVSSSDPSATTDLAAAGDRSRVRITSVGLCGSDLHWFGEGAIGDAVLRSPLVLGHEMAGVLLDGPLAGATVGVDPAIPCGHCPTCARGLGHLCPRVAFAGHGGVDGGLQEELVWPTRLLHRLPAGYDGAQGSLLEPLGVAVHALDLSHVRAGSRVGVVGCGPIGLLLIQLVAAVGADVVAVEPLAHRIAAARRAGAATAVAADPDGRLPSIVDLDGCEVVFEVSGADAGLGHAAALARPGGRIVLVGIPDQDSTTFQASLMRRKGITLVCVRRMTEAAYARGIALALAGVVDLSWLTTHRFDLDHAADAFILASTRQGLKVVIDVSAP